MSPRRRIDDDTGEQLPADTPAETPVTAPRPPLGRRRVVTTALAVSVMVAALTASVLMLVPHESHRRTTLRQAAALDVARSFTVEFMSPDPTGDFGANRYVDRMTAQVTGDFATWWEEARDRILITVAKGPHIEATVLYAGLERWNDDGSADVLVVVRRAIKDDAGKTVTEPTERVVETVRLEGEQWKISNLSPVV